MRPVAWPRAERLGERLLLVDPSRDAFGDALVGDLARFPDRGDLLVVNDAATLPASLHGETTRGEPIELRLVAEAGRAWKGIALGRGDWRETTEARGAAPSLSPGSRLRFRGLDATVVEGPPRRGAPLTLRFEQTGAAFWSALYGAGAPIQYSYMTGPLPLFHVQTAYASRPWAAEMPSAGRPLTWSLLLELRARGVGIARVTHAAGISSTGDPSVDATLPWPERFDIPEATVVAVDAAHRRGAKVVAVGTSVVRALEGAARQSGALASGQGTTNLVIGPGFAPRVVDGLYTGLHEATASHFSLLQAFAPLSLLERAYAHASAADYMGHEFGDSCLILRGALRSADQSLVPPHREGAAGVSVHG
jgi:S-adenosylmethionine:tRNA ribosyltransferase-isomerase